MYYFRAMPPDVYAVHVSVSGVPIADSKICGGVYKAYSCSFSVRFYRLLQHLNWSLQPSFSVSMTSNISSYFVSAQTVQYRTPTISTLSPVSGLPGTGFSSLACSQFTVRSFLSFWIKTTLKSLAGTLVTVRGQIFTDVYGSNTAMSSNGLNVRFLR